MQLSEDDSCIPRRSGAAVLRLSAFGGLDIQLNGAPLVGVRSTYGLALLLYLTLEADRPHARSRLATLLWPESNEDRARHNLRQTLTNLRQVLGDEAARDPFLLVTREWIQFNGHARYFLDVSNFLNHVDACQRHPHRRMSSCNPCMVQMQQMVGLYNGDFLRGFFVRNSTLWEEWVRLKREHFQQHVMWGLEQLVMFCWERRRDQEALRYLQRQIEIAPWDEVAHRRLIRLLVDLGRPRAALAQYDRCYQLLAEELGVEPSPETLELHNQIERHAAAREDIRGPHVVKGGQHNLPAPVNNFVGREPLLATLRERLADRACRLLTLTGPPGVGKSRLALEAAWEQLFAVEDGAYFVALGALNDPSEVSTALVHALGLNAHEAACSIAQVEAYVRDQELLLVLDNFEHLTAGAPLLARLLKAAPRLQLLVTSRVPLHLYGEEVFPIPPMVCDCAALDATSDLSLPEAVKLFVLRARASEPSFRLTADNLDAVARLCNALDGLPLAIELAARLVTLFSPQTMLSRIDKCLNWLIRDASDLTPRERTLRSSIAWSYRLLTKEERKLFRQLSVLDNGWTLEAAEAVCSVGRHKEQFYHLFALVEQGLLQRDADHGEPRFRMLEIVRNFAREQLRPEEQAAVLARYVATYGTEGREGSSRGADGAERTSTM